MVDQPANSQTTAIAGPWVAEHSICDDLSQRGLAVIAVVPELARIPGATPTRGMIAWVHSGIGACETDEQALATARLIASAPAMRAALQAMLDHYGPPEHVAHLCTYPPDHPITMARAALEDGKSDEQ